MTLPKPAHEMTFDEIAHWLNITEPTSENHNRMLAELTRRQTIAQLEATVAQKDASVAQVQAAHAAFWTVIVAALSAVISAVGVIVAAYLGRS